MTPAPTVLSLAFLIVAAQALAEETPSNGPESTDIAIADEPKTVDPATLMPKPLAATGDATFKGESLLELAQWFSDEHQVSIVFDKAALDEVGVPLGEPVYDTLNNEPIYLLLGRLKMLGLSWYYEDGLVTITNAETVASRLITRPYNLGDLLDAEYDRDAIVEVIVSTVASATWAENGGGESEVQWLGDVLFVSQTPEVHRRVEGLIAALRRHGRRTFIFDPPQHIQLREKLEQPISLKLEQTPLTLAMERLSEVSGADIRLDREALRDIGVREREPVSLDLTARSLRTMLQVALRDLHLTWLLRDGVIWVTSEEQAESLLKTAVYDVRDLCRDASEADALAGALTSQALTETWAENGGGEADLRFAKDGVLVVSQTEEGHEQLLTLLGRYREALRQSKPRDDQKLDPNESLTRYYRLPKVMAEGLPRVMRQLVAPDSWDDKAGVMIVPSVDETLRQPGEQPRVVPYSTLIITQTRAVHGEIAEFISKVRNGDADQRVIQGGFGGGGGGFGGGFFSIPDR